MSDPAAEILGPAIRHEWAGPDVPVPDTKATVPMPSFTRTLRRPMSLLIALFAMLSLVLTACGDEDDTALEEAEEEGVADAFVGETITVSGEVDQVLANGAFVIGGDYSSLGAEEGTLVFGTDIPTVDEGDLVQATGTVVDFVVADVENEFGIEFDDDEILVSYEEEYAVNAETVEVIPEDLAEDDPTKLEEAADDGEAEALVGETITVGGEVDSIVSPNAFRIDADEVGEGTLVLSADALELGESGTVSVTGTVVEFVLVDIEEEFGFDLDDDLFVDFDDQFAIVADTVEFIPDN